MGSDKKRGRSESERADQATGFAGVGDHAASEVIQFLSTLYLPGPTSSRLTSKIDISSAGRRTRKPPRELHVATRSTIVTMRAQRTPIRKNNPSTMSTPPTHPRSAPTIPQNLKCE